MTLEKLEEKFTRYEIARILGARSLQLAMDAPVLLKLTDEEKDEINFDTLKTAEKELIAGVLPITVKRPLPKKSEKTVKKLTEEEIREKLEKELEEKAKEEKLEKEVEEVEEIGEDGEEKVAKVEKGAEEGEIMEMAMPEDEAEPEEESEGAEEI